MDRSITTHTLCTYRPSPAAPAGPTSATLVRCSPNASFMTSTSRAIVCSVRVRWSSPDCWEPRICKAARISHRRERGF